MKRKASKKTAANVNVDIAISGGAVKTYNFDHEPTVAEALKRANIDADESSRVSVNGDEADPKDELEDGDTLTVTNKIKGGQS